MADDLVGSDRSARSWNWWLQGRSSRREYWIHVGLLIAVGLALANPAPFMSLVGAVVLLFVQIRRVHDLGRSAWWAFAAFVAPLICLPLMRVTSVETVNLVGELLTLMMIALVGAIPGDRAANRFGPTPPFTVRRVLTGR